VCSSDLAESATLAALVQKPTYFSPYGNHTDELLLRRNLVLDRMKSFGYIADQQLTEAKATEMVFVPHRESMPDPHFVMYVKEFLADKYGDRLVEEGGLKVTTTLDPNKQKAAEDAIAAGAATGFNHSGATNGAMVAIDPKTGDVLAMVGSKDYFDTSIDGNVNVALAKRQPGSAFKPIVYSTLFKGTWGPGSTLWDVKTDFGGGYSPNNYTLKNYGPLSIRQTLSGSLNIPAVKALYLAGLNNSLKTASDMGITTLTTPDRYGLSLVLGGGEIRLLELTGAYGVFANQGVRFPINPILKVEQPDGKVLEDRTNEGQKVLEPQIAYEISSILSDNNARSFIFGSKSALVLPGGRPAAVKTGTTDEFKDAWTVGYTPSLVAGVWVGNNNNTPMQGQVAAAMAAAPVWNQFMSKALEGTSNENFNRPDGLQDVTVDSLTGKLPSGDSPFGVRKDIFADWQIPKDRGSAYVKIKIDILTGKKASDSCPSQFVQEKVFTNVHSEVPDKPNWEQPVKAWAAAHGIVGASPPTETSDCASDNPSVSIIAPGNGDSVSGQTTIKASASAPSGIRQVDFVIDGILVDTDTSSPYQTNYNMNNLASGNHSIKVTAVSNAGFSASSSISISVGNDSGAPGNVSNLNAQNLGGGRVRLTWHNPNDSDLSYAQVYASDAPGLLGDLKGQVTITDKNSSIEFNVAPGRTYWFTVRLFDSSGNYSSNQISAGI
jgi:membrane peptidoglycan carboxypeptidase